MNKYLRAVSINFVFFAISTVFFLAITPFAIKVMGEEFYGLWAVLVALTLFSNVGNLGISAIVMKFSSESATHEGIQIQSNQVMTTGYFIVLVMAMVTSVILVLTRNLIADNINTSVEFREQFRQSILWVAASIFPQFLACVPQGFLLSQLHNQAVRQIELLSSIALWLGAIVIALVEKNLIFVAYWGFLSNALTLVLYMMAVMRLGIPFRLQFSLSTFRKMINFSGWMFLQSLAISLFQQFDKVIVSFTLGPILAGVYSIGTSLALRLPIIAGQVTEVMIPYASLKTTFGDQQTLYDTFRRLSRYISFLLAGISSLLIIWMYEILFLWISPGYAAQYTNIFRILIIAYSLLSLCRPGHQTLTGMGKVKFAALIYLFSTLLMLIGVFFLSSSFGFTGAVVANLLMVSLLTFNLSVYHTLQSPIQWRDVLTDLQWGLFLPILIFGLSLFLSESNIIYKLVETFILGILFVNIIIKDAFVKNRLLQVLLLVKKHQI
jgi:O-antigen/teichoic acid export membrane protein